MNLFFISLQFPPDYYHLIERLHNLSFSVFGIADKPMLIIDESDGQA